MSAVAQSRSWVLLRRLPLLLGMVAGLALVLAIASAVMLYRLRSAALVGTDLHRSPAPSFHLTDQNGQPVSLAQFRGKPVILTFLYTHCPDACPLIADQLHQTVKMLGPQASQVGILAVSTDPVGDNRAAAQTFSQVHGMTGRWHYLLGSAARLQPVWKDYYIGVTPGQSPAAASPGTVIGHSEAVFVIDKSGRERALLGLPFRARDLASDVRKLLAQ